MFCPEGSLEKLVLCADTEKAKQTEQKMMSRENLMEVLKNKKGARSIGPLLTL